MSDSKQNCSHSCFSQRCGEAILMLAIMIILRETNSMSVSMAMKMSVLMFLSRFQFYVSYLQVKKDKIV